MRDPPVCDSPEEKLHLKLFSSDLKDATNDVDDVVLREISLKFQYLRRDITWRFKVLVRSSNDTEATCGWGWGCACDCGSWLRTGCRPSEAFWKYGDGSDRARGSRSILRHLP